MANNDLKREVYKHLISDYNDVTRIRIIYENLNAWQQFYIC